MGRCNSSAIRSPIPGSGSHAPRLRRNEAKPKVGEGPPYALLQGRLPELAEVSRRACCCCEPVRSGCLLTWQQHTTASVVACLCPSLFAAPPPSSSRHTTARFCVQPPAHL